MPGIGEQGQRACQHAVNGFNDHEPEIEKDRNGKSAVVGAEVFRVAVTVAVTVHERALKELSEIASLKTL